QIYLFASPTPTWWRYDKHSSITPRERYNDLPVQQVDAANANPRSLAATQDLLSLRHRIFILLPRHVSK
ncbi:unnamed protein product, partial [Amoebophrya sp. A25]